MSESGRNMTLEGDPNDQMLPEGVTNSENEDNRSAELPDEPPASSPSSIPSTEVEDDLEESGSGSDAEADPDDDDLEESGSGSDAEADPDDDERQCQICLEKKNINVMTGWQCRCVYCNECLSQLFRVSFTTRALYPPKCGCGQRIQASDVKSSLDEDVLELSGKVPEEWWTQNPTYCAREGCGAFIPASRFGQVDDKMSQFASCGSCNTITCSKCKQTQAAHDGLCGKCPRKIVPSELYAFIKKNRLSRCPSCKTLAELEEGCNSVRCACGTDFCFECGAPDSECDCPVTEDYEVEDKQSHEWTSGAVGLEAEVEVRSWPQHEKVLINPDRMDEEFNACTHLRLVEARGQARCHGCLQIFGVLQRCFDCDIELCRDCLS